LNYGKRLLPYGKHEDKGFGVLASTMAVAKKSKFEMAVIDLVRQKRMDKKLSQNMIAAFIGTHRSYIGQVESPENHQKYNLDHLNMIADAMGCSPKEFIPDNPIPEKEDPTPKKKHPKKKKG
jgi:hypothetical protein